MKPAASSFAEQARFISESVPPGGLFAGQEWRISPFPFHLSGAELKQLELLGRILLQFNRAVNLLYRQAVAGKKPAWILDWLDQGKSPEILEWQRSDAFKNDLPRVLRPDLLVTEKGFSISELDSVPGGIGLTAWLNRTYSELQARFGDNPNFQPGKGPVPAGPATTSEPHQAVKTGIVGGADGMIRGFSLIFHELGNVHVVVSDESQTYRPEMEWLCSQLGNRFQVRNADFTDFARGDSVYRFFELFDLPRVPNAKAIFQLAAEEKIHVTSPPKPVFEEKLLFALLWNRNLHDFWRQQLGESFFTRLREMVPYTWVVDPAPLPPQGAIPEINLTDWHQLKNLSQRERDLVLKVSGYSEKAWGARGVFVGNDLSLDQWSKAVDEALGSFGKSPYVLQKFHPPKLIHTQWFDFKENQMVDMPGRVRLCPYYFVVGEGDSARTQIGGILATICPADKKIIHGMRDAVLVPCVGDDDRKF